jgi:biotin operon repressor
MERFMSERLLNFLKSTERWVKAGEIESFLGMRPTEVRDCVNALRQSCEPVVSGPEGYKYATSEQEVEDCLRNLYARAKSIRDAAIGLEKSKSKVNGSPMQVQAELFDFIPRRHYG